MNKKEMTQIRRRFNPEKSAISRIRGCYVNNNREIVSMFNLSPQTMPEEELEKFLSIFKKILSGTPDQNQVNLEFSASQVREGEEYALLAALRDTALTEDEPVETFYHKIIDNFVAEDNYLILLMHDAYDVFHFTSDDRQADESETVFQYIICGICPVRLSKPALSYHAMDNEFHTRKLDWVVNAPDVGFMFPTFEDGGPNIYNVLYYMRNVEEAHDEFADAVFHADRPMPANEQKEVFQEILTESLAEDCSFDVIQAVNEQIGERLKEQKADKEAEPLRISRNEMKDMLRISGVSEDRVEAFETQYNEKLGEGTDISAVNLVETRQISLKTPDVVIKVAPNRGDLVETRIINGLKYILIRAEEGVELNGVNISITDENSGPF